MWLATGGRSGVNDRVDILKNRKILVFADWLIRWKQAPDTMTLPADTPIQPIQQARLELVLNELRHYWSEETVQAAAPLIEDLDLEIKSVTYIKSNEDIPLKERVRRADKLSDELATCLYKAARKRLPGLPRIQRRQESHHCPPRGWHHRLHQPAR